MTTNNEIKTITIIGQGNVSYHYNKIMTNKGFDVKVVSSRLPLNDKDKDRDLIVIAVKDEAIKEVCMNIKHTNSILVHTSGYVDTLCLKDVAENYGSLYPLQSLKKEKDIDFNTVPLCTFGNNKQTEERLNIFAKKLSSIHYNLTDEQRKCLHLAAVFCNNFPNHLFGIAKRILDKSNIPFSTLFPLIDTTIERAKQGDPFSFQTGPAIRGEKTIMNEHKERLNVREKEIYDVLSNDIMKEHNIKIE